MTLGSSFAYATTFLACAFAAYSFVRLRRRDNLTARRFAKYSMWAAISCLPLCSLSVFFELDASSKATALARIISATINCLVVDFPVGLAALLLWVIAKQRQARARA